MNITRVVLRASAAVAVFSAIAVAPVAAAHLDYPNRFVDAGFEGALTTDGPPFVGFWEGFSLDGAFVNPAAAFTPTMPRTGTQSLELLIDNLPNAFAGAFQDVTFSPSLAGNMAYFSGWHKLLGDAGGTEARIEWRDSVNDVEISRTPNLAVSPVGSGYEEFVLSSTIPAGADTARVVYAIQSFGGAANQQVWVDDVNFNFVPEPVSGCLAAVAGLFLSARRRRA